MLKDNKKYIYIRCCILKAQCKGRETREEKQQQKNIIQVAKKNYDDH